LSEETVPGVPLSEAVPSADEVADGDEAESVGEAGSVAVGVLPVGDTAGDEDVGNDDGDTEADAGGEVGTVPDGLVCGDGATAAPVDDAGTVAEGSAEQCAVGRVGNGIGAGNLTDPSLGVGEARVMAAVPVATELPVPAPPDVENLHFCWRAASGDGEEPFPVPFPAWEPCPSPDKVPFPFVAPPPPFVPSLPFPVSTVEPTCTMAARNGGTTRPRHAMNAMPPSMVTTGRNWRHDDRNWRHDDRRDRDRGSRAAAFSFHAQRPRHA
jgi:hypothetical protein